MTEKSGAKMPHKKDCTCAACANRRRVKATFTGVRLDPPIREWLMNHPLGLRGWIEDRAKREMDGESNGP